jgi:signal transduction histidine kinase
MQSKIDQIGLVKAIQSMLDDFSDEFTGSTFQIDPESMVLAKKIPLFVSEVIYYACRELVRNACDHARKTPQENLHLEIQVQSLQKSSEPALMISVRDDGKVTQPNPSLGFEEMRPIGKVLNGGAGAGLQFHSAMLAAVGARLEIVTKPGSGTTATILLPASKYVEMTNDLERSPGSQG